MGVSGGAISGVFVPRHETDSTFASTSLQRNETAIAFASGERPILGQFEPAKVLVVSKLPSSRAMCEKVRPARPGMGVSAKKFALQAQNGRKMLFSGVLGELFRG